MPLKESFTGEKMQGWIDELEEVASEIEDLQERLNLL